MPKISTFLNRFTFGEVSPLLSSRTDIERYGTAAKRLENFIPTLQGPIRRRGGTYFVAESGNSEKGRGGDPVILVDFSFSDTTSYLLEFGHLYMRVYYLGARVDVAPNTAYEIATVFGQADLFSADGVPLLKKVQSGDVMWLCVPTQKPQQLSRYAHTDWRMAVMTGWGARPNAQAICLFRERLCVGSGTTVRMSQAGAFGNFELTTSNITADDPIQIDVYSEKIDEIQWMVPAGNLLVGTSGGEFLIGETTVVDPLGPENIKVTPQTAFGSNSVGGMRVGAVVIFCQRAGRKLREFVYEYSGDSYNAIDLTAAAEHITESGVISMAWQSEPDEILWCVRQDGQLLGFSFSKEQEMNAWHRHILGGGGHVCSVMTLPARMGGRDEIWLAVTRTINGAQKTYIETMEPGHRLGGDPTDDFFVDCGLSGTGSGGTVEGLSHLEGATVTVLADGGVQPDRVVKDGKIQLEFEAVKVQVGFRFRSLIETLPVDVPVQDGTSQARIKRITGSYLRLLESALGRAGAKEDTLEPLEYWDAPRIMDQAPALYTGDLRFPWPGGYENNLSLVIAQDAPLPFLLTAIIADVMLEGIN